MSVLFVGCGYDNYDEPDSLLTGVVTYNGSAVGVRGTENELEIWQDGYALSEKVQAYIAQDGTFSASLFAGEYKIVRLSGAPWLDQSTDTIRVKVRGTTHIEVPVTPYFTVDNVSYVYADNKVTATFTVNQVVEDATLKSVYLYMGANYLTNNVNNDLAMYIDLSNITLGEPATITASLPEKLQKLDFIYARIGANSSKSTRFIFSPSEKINL